PPPQSRGAHPRLRCKVPFGAGFTRNGRVRTVRCMTTTDTTPTTTPYEIAPDTFVVPWSLHAPPVGEFCINSMVIRGAEPVIVDTGAPANRAAWLESVFSLVEPEDVRWIFLSHDDRDHAGNLLQVLDA